ncbi:toxin-activating lysine-acyltransferase [Pseudovibrio sp. WM33]|uniref:toxin-activating lysine-acyltransferase n=1 Tax=Pseudovibrio sp. WM33 TaxID=1735585 RepID=UPI0007AEAB91|nr:toxin-activating lysine-acyltransferase [Pseudovibrio sp. WM33]KZL23313.1 Hemolysin-activating lysine-acyltransferase HlyC [Pseudovibrio sp. WM33]
MKQEQANWDDLKTQTFASALGQAVWLMTVSKEHRNQKIQIIEEVVTPAILFQQFKLYFKRKQPIAFLSWAAVSDEVKVRFESGDRQLSAQDWRSGKNIIVIECVSPFTEKSAIVNQFLSRL